MLFNLQKIVFKNSLQLLILNAHKASNGKSQDILLLIFLRF